MKITELILKNFGKFTNKQILLTDGINIIYGENESGKTTLHTFLKGMLLEWKESAGVPPQQIHSVPMSLGRIQTFMRESCGLPVAVENSCWSEISIGMRKAAL
mgnify:CR=1 FL=1